MSLHVEIFLGEQSQMLRKQSKNQKELPEFEIQKQMGEFIIRVQKMLGFNKEISQLKGIQDANCIAPEKLAFHIEKSTQMLGLKK